LSTRRLIVNADDFGRSHGINRGVAVAHSRGIVTSASLMVRWPGAVEAAELARSMPALSVGLHLDLSEWEYDQDRWLPIYEVVNGDSADVAAEIRRQLSLFRSLIDRDPSHLDSHQHVHRAEPVRSLLVELSKELGVPLRSVTAGIEYRGDFYGRTAKSEPLPEALTPAAFQEVVRSLRPGTSELGCHPAAAIDFTSSYSSERLIELDVLCAPETRTALELESVELVSFHAAARLLPAECADP
jgi:predicted glycoside hydrolase/deacetylase ChbG (UPF0249 family)